MTDPAVEAAKRAWSADGWPGELGLSEGHLAEAAARAALKPIRDVLDRLAEETAPPCDFGKLYDLFQKAINDLSPLVYAEEEL